MVVPLPRFRHLRSRASGNGLAFASSRTIGGVTLDVHTLLYASAAVTIGFQSILFWAFAKVYGMREGIVPWDPWFHSLVGLVTLEVGLFVGLVLLILGLALGVVALTSWNLVGFGRLEPRDTMRLVIPSATAVLLAFQIAYGAFFLSVLEIRASRPAPTGDSAG